MNHGVSYPQFYDILLNIREIFHSHGRIDDANAKLDEIIKLIFLSYYEATKNKRFCLSYVKEYAQEHLGESNSVAPALHLLFENCCRDVMFLNSDGTCIFGSAPSLSIQSSENSFAEKIITEIEKIDFVNLTSDKNIVDFDIINECFGHFVRENFRNNKEDAQYMTPAEISSPILEMIFSDIVKDRYLDNVELSSFKIMDPTCGVGTLLIESTRKYIEFITKTACPSKNTLTIVNDFLENGVIGQDKVDRMVRFSKLNSVLIGSATNKITIGNSICDTTNVDKYKGQIDLIFTNPPFGADYDISSLTAENFLHIEEIKKSKSKVCSEILMLLKCLSLLKENGYLAIVLPDSVFSAKGIYSDVRRVLIENYDIKAVVELPSVTFAQAGTRTKTSILYLKKSKPHSNADIIMGVCEDIGYNVKERTGVPVKIATKKNEVIDIANAYSNYQKHNASNVLLENPSVTVIKSTDLIGDILNPSFYSSTRMKTIENIDTIEKNGIKMFKLSELVKFDSLGRKSYSVDNQTCHISVLHINPNCVIDFGAVESFSPISKGRECNCGDLIFSKINPRIPRMAVIPQFEKRLVCSNEFEIMKPIGDIDAYTLCLLLKSPYVQRQINDLTSGTSSSHSRIKREELANILVPCPINRINKMEYEKIGQKIKFAFETIYDADRIIIEQLNIIDSIVS